MKRGGSGGRRVPILLFCVAAFAQEKGIDALRAKAQAEYEGQKKTWERFVFEGAAMPDDEVQDMTAAYDKCIDLYQRIAEASEDGDAEADVVIVQLARRTAKLRASLWAREMAKKAKAAASRPKEPEPPPPEEPAKDSPPPPEAPPETTPPEKPPEAETPAPPAQPELVLPTIEETKDRRSAGTQSARNFVMQYFADRKYKSLIGRCGNAQCYACAKGVGHLNVLAARRAFWLSWSPLFRADEKERSKWRAKLAEWRNDPRKLPEVLTKLNITQVDYHGLWADIEWEQWGVTNDAKKTHEKVLRRLVRAGNHWFFFDAEHDRDFFAAETEPERGSK